MLCQDDQFLLRSKDLLMTGKAFDYCYVTMKEIVCLGLPSPHLSHIKIVMKVISTVRQFVPMD